MEVYQNVVLIKRIVLERPIKIEKVEIYLNPSLLDLAPFDIGRLFTEIGR